MDLIFFFYFIYRSKSINLFRFLVKYTLAELYVVKPKYNRKVLDYNQFYSTKGYQDKSSRMYKTHNDKDSKTRHFD